MIWHHWSVSRAPALLILVLTTQCVGFQRENQGTAQAYLQNRTMDARDVLSVTGGFFGFGVWADASILSIGLGGQFDPGLLFADPSEVQNRVQNPSQYGGNSIGLSDGEVGFHNENRGSLLVLGVEQTQPVDDSKRKRSNVRTKGGNRIGIPLNGNYADYTNLGVNVCVFLCVHIEANPGELVDLIIGFGGLDLYSDDAFHSGGAPIPQQHETPIKDDVKEILK